MAEYVRRRRPPATHPYWERMYDRAHPPPLLVPIVVPTVLGCHVGLFGGVQGVYSSGQAVHHAGLIAGILGGLAFVLFVPFVVADASRHLSLRDRWLAAGGLSLVMAACCFALSFMPILFILLWYSLCSGMGGWQGLVLGGLMGGIPGTTFAMLARRRWRQRQKSWPRWEQMRARRPLAAVPGGFFRLRSLGRAASEPIDDLPATEGSESTEMTDRPTDRASGSAP